MGADTEQQAKGVVSEAQKQVQHLTEEAKSTSAVTEQARQTAAQATQKADDAARARGASWIRPPARSGADAGAADAASRQLENLGAPDAVRQPAATIQYATGARRERRAETRAGRGLSGGAGGHGLA